jgi:hypothetical protein
MIKIGIVETATRVQIGAAGSEQDVLAASILLDDVRAGLGPYRWHRSLPYSDNPIILDLPQGL